MRVQFTLRALFVIVTAAALGLAWWTSRRQTMLVETPTTNVVVERTLVMREAVCIGRVKTVTRTSNGSLLATVELKRGVKLLAGDPFWPEFADDGTPILRVMPFSDSDELRSLDTIVVADKAGRFPEVLGPRRKLNDQIK